MSDYDEHLISMAGGDGDPLDAIQARLATDRDDFAEGYADQTIRDRETLLALVREQRARLAVVAELANWAGKHGWTLDAAAIRAALEPKP